eukprot:1136233-Pelagomonas_calceolata.AAC.1
MVLAWPFLHPSERVSLASLVPRSFVAMIFSKNGNLRYPNRMAEFMTEQLENDEDVQRGSADA